MTKSVFLCYRVLLRLVLMASVASSVSLCCYYYIIFCFNNKVKKATNLKLLRLQSVVPKHKQRASCADAVVGGSLLQDITRLSWVNQRTSSSSNFPSFILPFLSFRFCLKVK